VEITASVWCFIAEEEISVYNIQICKKSIFDMTLSAYNNSSSCKPTDVILKRDRYTVIPSWRIYYVWLNICKTSLTHFVSYSILKKYTCDIGRLDSSKLQGDLNFAFYQRESEVNYQKVTSSPESPSNVSPEECVYRTWMLLLPTRENWGISFFVTQES
jgi:hypothetical protein